MYVYIYKYIYIRKNFILAVMKCKFIIQITACYCLLKKKYELKKNNAIVFFFPVLSVFKFDVF